MVFDPSRTSKNPGGSGTPGAGTTGGGFNPSLRTSGSGTTDKSGAKGSTKSGSKKDAPKKKGLLGQLAEMVKGVPGDLARLPGVLYKEAKAGAAGGGLVGSYGRSGGDVSEAVNPLSKTNLDTARASQPLAYEILSSPARTVRYVPDAAAAVRPSWTPVAGQGPGFGKSELGKDLRDRGYLGVGLTVASDVSMLAGGAGALGKAAGLGKAAKAAELEQIASASSRAAGLSKVAARDELLQAGLDAVKSGNVVKGEDMLRAAKQMEDASALRASVAQSGKATQIGNTITEKAGTVSRLGAGVADLPAKPYTLAAQGLGKVVGAGASALSKSEKGVQAVQRSGQLVERAGRTKTVADMYHKMVNAPTQEALYRHIENGQAVDEVANHLASQFPKQAALFEKLKRSSVATAPPVPGETPKQRSVRLRQFEKQTAAALQQGLRSEVATKFGRQAGEFLDPASPLTPTEQLAEAGYVMWDPKTGRKVDETLIAVTPNRLVVPKDVHNSLKVYSLGAAAGTTFPLRVYDKVTGAWKNSVLALNPAWHYGNVLGNVVMAGLGAGLTPGEMLTHGREAIRLAKAGEIPPEIASAGYRFTEKAVDTGAAPTGIKGRLRHPIQASYAFNDAVDGIGRTMVYMAKKDKGFSSEAALKMSLDAMGDYSRMNPFERNVVRRIVPFYAWQKHITKLAFRLPLEHPARVAWTLHLADMGDELVPDEGAEGFDAATLKVGDNRIGVSQLFPFGSPFLADPTVRGLGYQLNPLIKAAAVGGIGISPNKGFDKVSTPETEFGDKPSPLAQDPVRFGQYLTQQVKQVRQAQDLVAGETKTRYETGQPLKKQKYADTAQSRWQQILKMIGPSVKPDGSAAPSGVASSVGTRSSGTASGGGFDPRRRAGK